MSNIPISSLPVAISLTGAELVPVVQGGTTKRTTVSAIAQFAGGAAFAEPIIVTDLSNPGAYTVPDGALYVVIDKTDGADVVLPAISSKEGSVTIVAAQGTAYPFDLTLTDGTFIGSLTTYPFTSDYQAATFTPVVGLDTYAVS